MTVEQVKQQVAALSHEEQRELEAFLFQLRKRRDPQYLQELESRITEASRAHWLTPDEFVRRVEPGVTVRS